MGCIVDVWYKAKVSLDNTNMLSYDNVVEINQNINMCIITIFYLNRSGAFWTLEVFSARGQNSWKYIISLMCFGFFKKNYEVQILLKKQTSIFPDSAKVICCLNEYFSSRAFQVGATKFFQGYV